jgi:hypothetical protein
MTSRGTHLGKRSAAPCQAAGSENVQPDAKRRRTWADKVAEKQVANGAETDQYRVAQRQKQVDFGKNTLAYDHYVATVPRHLREPKHPVTPLVSQKCSTRSFVGQVKRWRRMLFEFNKNSEPPAGNDGTCASAAGGEVPVARRAEACASTPGVGNGNVPCDGGGTRVAVPEHAGNAEIAGEAGSVPAPDAADALSNYEEDDGIELDDMGNVISIRTAVAESPENTASTSPGTVRGDLESPAQASVFDRF